MAWGIVAGAAVGLAGSAMSADAAGDAADTQAQATANANQLTQRQFQSMRKDLGPYRAYGEGATNKLATLLGVAAPTSKSGGTLDNPFTLEDFVAYNDRIAPNHGFGQAGRESDAESQFRQYTTGGYGNDQTAIAARFGFDPGRISQVQQEIADMEAAQKADPGYGSLLKQFTGADLPNDPGYQFGLNEGYKGLDRSLARGGNVFSGAALKAAQRFGNDYAGTKFNEAFNRDASSKSQIYNFLSGGASLGQNAAAMTGNAGQNMANTVGANTIGLGNAVGASQIAQANAISGGLNNAVNQYQQNELLKKLNTPSASSSGWGGGYAGGGWGTGNGYGNQDYGQYF